MIQGSGCLRTELWLNGFNTADEQQQQAESQKAALLSEAESVIQPLERAVRLNMATDEERARLESWERYSVLVSRVDTANPEWPQKPE
ncbi:Putative phage tail assembly protein [Escherichia coli]|uniref:Phage tail assembly protein n=1 Tax=Escherichia coli TaxID=562 RepID=A0A376J950_ECOLX|nr:Putative phage tail assembly protein [Escherichia coli]